MGYASAYNPHFGDLGTEVTQRWPESPIIQARVGKRPDTIGLAISGGGYRSAIFGYGVLWGLHELGVLKQIHYLSVVSGGSWIGTPFSMTERFDMFFREVANGPNFMEEGFESLLPNPARVLQEAVIARDDDDNYVSNIYGRMLARTFLREHGDYSRFKPLSDAALIRDADRPFLIVNGTVSFRRPESFDITQECFEMTRLYCGSRSLGYIDTASLKATKYPIRIRDAIAVSGAALAAHLPGLGAEVAGIGLGREVENFAKRQRGAPKDTPQADHLDLSDGGHYNNLGVESLINRGCGYIIVVDAEHDPESKRKRRSHQAYSGLRTLIKRHHIPQPIAESTIKTLDVADEAVHVVKGTKKIPDILYIKLKSSKEFDQVARRQPYNEPGLLQHLFDRGTFSFDPQYSTAKLDYTFTEHRNLSELGRFVVQRNSAKIKGFVGRAQ